MSKPIMWVNSFNKSQWTYLACAGALAQTIPCNIIFTDAQSSDDSQQQILKAIDNAPRGAEHNVVFRITPEPGENTFKSLGDHFMFALDVMKKEFPESEWLLQCGSDDISLPDRAKLCMEAVEKNPCSAIATTMFFTDPDKALHIVNGESVDGVSVSGYPQQSGYVDAGEALQRLGYGSVIAGYSRKFLEKVGSFNVTPDVYYGFLAALDEGFYVVANPQHIHIQHPKESNLGFGGKLLAAEGAELARLNELNQFQLYKIYYELLKELARLFPQGIRQDHLNALYNMMLNHSMGWFNMREHLHQKKIVPSIM